MKIPFNKPHLTGKEATYIHDVVYGEGKLSGNGKYTQLCQEFFEQRYGFSKCLLTTSCTDALEMAAILLDLKPGDEVIMPSYTFVSTANAFMLRGAHLVFCDSMANHPNMDVYTVEALITPRTRAIVPVHYAGMACDMDSILALADKYGLFVVEDAAQAIDSYYTGKDRVCRPLGSIGHLAAFSFHETKNIISGEGGMLVINDERFAKRAEIIWEKGTNRSAFFRGEIDKYGWVDVGSSFLPSEITAAFLRAQLESLEDIQARRGEIWKEYQDGLCFWAAQNEVQMPIIPDGATNNAHIFYLVLPCVEVREHLIAHLRKSDIHAVFHYLSLHESTYFQGKHDGRKLPNSDRYSDCLVRLPMYYDLSSKDLVRIVEVIQEINY